MKIEKLTDNKIRVIINLNEMGLKNMNVHSIMTKAIETQEIFLNILKQAEKEVNFNTDGCKLLIEAYSSFDDILVFTITKYLPNSDNGSKKKKLTAKIKSFNKNYQHATCRFESFSTFCEFCNAIKCIHKTENSKLAKNIALYFWKNNYYLVLRNINSKYENMSLFFSTLSEFGKLFSFSNNFEYKLLEHGKVIIKKNAIDVGINFLVD